MKLFARLFKAKSSKNTLPKGWTETRISEDTFDTEIPLEQKDNWDEKRRVKDNIKELSKIDGFHDKPNGRAGTIYFVKKGKVCEFHYETSAVQEFNILIWFDESENWFLPKIETISIADKQLIKKELKSWMNSKGVRADL